MKMTDVMSFALPCRRVDTVVSCWSLDSFLHARFVRVSRSALRVVTRRLQAQVRIRDFHFQEHGS
jgi:hypothetical protein